MRTRPALSRAALAVTTCLGLMLPLSASHAQGMLNLLNSLSSGATGALGALVGGSPAAAPTQGDDLLSMLTRSVETIDEPREVEIGRQLSAVLLGSKPLHPDARLQRYVNELGRWISLQSERPGLAWTFVVLDDPGFNAFAAPGGYVFVTKGLIDRCADESELAGILAHEIIHVTQRHHLHAMRKTAQSGLLTQLVASQINSNALGNMVASQFLALGRNLYARGLDQADEHAADRAGVELATRSGFDPYGLVASIQRLRSEGAGNPLFAHALATHPPAQARLEYLEAAMGRQLDAWTGGPAVTVAQRMEPPAPAVTPAAATLPPANAAPRPAAKPAPARKPVPAKKGTS